MKYRLLRIDLTKKSWEAQEIPSDVMAKFLGGKGLAAFYMLHEVKPKIDPLDIRNKLMYFVGPLTAVFPGTDRFVVASKSPLSNTFSDSYAGGWFGSELRKAGWMGLIIEGRADHLVYLRIEVDKVSIEDASHLSGMSSEEVDRVLPGFRVAAIGLAGEKLVKYANIICNASKNGKSGVVGRGGLGAVMGSKNLKAIAISAGDKDRAYLELFDKTKELRKKNISHLKSYTIPEMGIGGNLWVVDFAAEAKILPMKNFRSGTISEHTKIDENAIRDIMVKKETCYQCPAACGVRVKLKKGPYAGLELSRIEYETVAMCGPNCGQTSLAPIIKSNRLCNDYGLDTISTGAVVAFVMECSERGLIDYNIRFGDAEGQITLIESIARREGIGDLLAEGVASASKKIGEETEPFAMHSKGLEYPGYDPRGSVGMAISYATAERGGCHTRSWTMAEEIIGELDPFSAKGKAMTVKRLQDTGAAMWSLIVCDSLGYSIEQGVEMLKEVDFDITEDQMLEIGERICNMTRLFNIREGFMRRDDCIPKRLFEAREDTGWKISSQKFGMMLDEYYELRGWDTNGKPSHEILKKLGLEGKEIA